VQPQVLCLRVETHYKSSTKPLKSFCPIACMPELLLGS
jgi:hypothetical protein